MNRKAEQILKVDVTGRVWTPRELRDAALDEFEGSLIYVWIYKGASIAAATEHLIIELPNVFPTDPEAGAPLSASAFVRPTDSAQVIVGGFGDFSFDYEAGSGPLPGYNSVSVVPEPVSATLSALLCLFVATSRRRRRSLGIS